MKDKYPKLASFSFLYLVTQSIIFPKCFNMTQKLGSKTFPHCNILFFSIQIFDKSYSFYLLLILDTDIKVCCFFYHRLVLSENLF